MHLIYIGDFNLYQLVILFFIYSFLGWCLEVVYATTKTGKFTNRGFLNGPICPIYGFGVIILLLMLQNFFDNIWVLFVVSIILTSTLEFLTGLILEKFLHKKWWDYSNEHFNIKGYICLKFSIAWGFASVFVLKIINPLLLNFIKSVHLLVGYIAIGLMITGIFVDLIFTVLQVTKLSKNIKEIEKINKNLKTTSNFIGEKLSGVTNNIQIKLITLMNKVKFSRLGKAYPNLSYSIDEVKLKYKSKIQSKKIYKVKNELKQLDIITENEQDDKI